MASDPADHHSCPPVAASSIGPLPAYFLPTATLEVKLICSYGGMKILLSGGFEYSGGKNRIVTVSRDATLDDILLKMTELFGCPVELEYQLSNKGIDILISVVIANELKYMMEDYDSLITKFPSGTYRLPGKPSLIPRRLDADR